MCCTQYYNWLFPCLMFCQCTKHSLNYRQPWLLTGYNSLSSCWNTHVRLLCHTSFTQFCSHITVTQLTSLSQLTATITHCSVTCSELHTVLAASQLTWSCHNSPYVNPVTVSQIFSSVLEFPRSYEMSPVLSSSFETVRLCSGSVVELARTSWVVDTLHMHTASWLFGARYKGLRGSG
jgi:hypothetical protein